MWGFNFLVNSRGDRANVGENNSIRYPMINKLNLHLFKVNENRYRRFSSLTVIEIVIRRVMFDLVQIVCHADKYNQMSSTRSAQGPR